MEPRTHLLKQREEKPHLLRMASEDAQLLPPRVLPAESAARSARPLAPFQEGRSRPRLGGTRPRLPEAQPRPKLAQGWLCVVLRPGGDRLPWSTPLGLPGRWALTKALASSESGRCSCLSPLVQLSARAERPSRQRLVRALRLAASER